MENELNELIPEWMDLCCTSFLYRELVPTITKIAHHDQTGLFYERLSLQKTYNTTLYASFRGSDEVQNSRNLYTLVPTLCYDLTTSDITLPPTLTIMAADTKNGKMSDYHKKSLIKLGLSPGFDQKYLLFNASSHNGWNQKKNMHQNVKCLRKCGRGTLVHIDNWGHFQLKKEFIYQLLKYDIYATFNPPNGSHAFGWNDSCLNQDIKRIMDTVRAKYKKKYHKETYTKSGKKRALPKAYHAKMAQEVMAEIVNDDDDVYHEKHRTWLDKTGFN